MFYPTSIESLKTGINAKANVIKKVEEVATKMFDAITENTKKETSFVSFVACEYGSFVAALFNFRNDNSRTNAIYWYKGKRKIERLHSYPTDLDYIKSLATNNGLLYEERNAPVNPLNVGDVLICTFGYDACVNTFYEVIEKKGQMVTVCEIEQNRIHDECMEGKTYPLKGKFKGEKLRKKANSKGQISTSNGYASLLNPIINDDGVSTYEGQTFYNFH